MLFSHLNQRDKKLINIIFLIIITFLIYHNCIISELVNLDDPLYITDNPDIRELSISQLKKIFFSFHKGAYKPLTLLSYMIEYKFFGMNPAVFHFTNVLLHSINCILVFFLILFFAENQIIIAFFTALLFCIHPMRVESVAWASERKDMLYSVFLLSFFLCYVIYLKNSNKKIYWLALLFFIFSMLVKPQGITAPILLLLFDYYFLGISKLTDFDFQKNKLAFIFVSLFFVILNLLGNSIEKGFIFHSLLDSIFIGAYNYLFYLYKFFLPINLTAYYYSPLILISNSFIKIIIIFIWLLIFACVIYLCRFSKLFTLAFLFFFITLAPTLHIITIGKIITADRYTYIPYLFLFFLSVMLMTKFNNFLKTNKSIILQKSLWLIVSVIILILTYLTYNRTLVWQNNITLWTDVIIKQPRCAEAYVGRGLGYFARNQLDLAIKDYTDAIAIDAADYVAYYNRGLAYLYKIEFDKAIADFSKVIELQPTMIQAYTNRAFVKIIKKDYQSAITDLKKALTIDANNFDANYNLAGAYLALGDKKKALYYNNIALKINPNDTRALEQRKKL